MNSCVEKLKNFRPKIIVEDLIRDEFNIPYDEIHCFCFNGVAKFFIRLYNKTKCTCLYDEKLNIIDDVFSVNDCKIKISAKSNIDFLFATLVIMQLLSLDSATMLDRNADNPQGLTKVVK